MIDKTALGCLTLMILTDGGIYKDEVYFVTTDDVLAKLFSKLSRTLWGKTPTIINYKRGKYSWMKLKLKDTYAANMLMKLTVNKRRIPEFIMEECNSKIIARYLGIVASTDGGVAFYQNKRNNGYSRTERHVIIGCKNPVIKKQLQRLFLRLGIKTRSVKERSRISGKYSLKRFKEKVGFVPKCLVTSKSLKWKSYTKNEVLNLMLASYNGSAAPRDSVP